MIFYHAVTAVLVDIGYIMLSLFDLLLSLIIEWSSCCIKEVHTVIILNQRCHYHILD